MASIKEFASKWGDIINESDLPQPLRSIAEFVKEELQKEKE